MNSAEIEALDDAALGKLADETLVAGVDVDINGEAWTGRACEVICARNERIRRAAKKKRDEEEAPGPDDYRTPPGAPTIAGCPVEELPAAGTRIRVWHHLYFGAPGPIESPGLADYGGSAKVHPYGASEPRKIERGEVLAWRPAAVGPGKVEG